MTLSSVLLHIERYVVDGKHGARIGVFAEALGQSAQRNCDWCFHRRCFGIGFREVHDLPRCRRNSGRIS